MSIDLKLDPAINNYAVFGNPIKHSKSPQIHSLFAKQENIALHYQAIAVPLDCFDEYVKAFAIQSGKGLNITVPFKEDAYAICTNLTQRAKYANSVNTIWFDGAKIYGDTTDGQGLINDLMANNGIALKNKSILVLGAGGSVRSILQPLCEQKPARIVIANRTVERAIELAKTFSIEMKIEASSYSALENNQFDLIINATSLSLRGELPPIPNTILNKNACCYDLMYSDKPTIFMQWAKEQAAVTVLDGLGMLVEQAAEGFLIWHGVKPDTAPVIKALRA